MPQLDRGSLALETLVVTARVRDGIIHEVISNVRIMEKAAGAINHVWPRKDACVAKEPIQFGVRRFLAPVVAGWEVRP